ncbi:PP2C family serine/threonine-protein phosphatase [Pseudomonas sp. C2B4]|uniref:PP2C family protein-serine/threonine phosphatase n=1 Tax=Pseudomonas sp. C2B4 TaxID=2735270 RepID=UPI001586C375|nr:PP2C family serine/threonine-protein phosphatase [Pseudomonas sp. C2B4]NUU38169.1 serine/threonine-protein phosphatase [Pseudomonas sp. C2B4]
MLAANPWRSAARTDAGKVRARNEDAFLDCPQHGIWVVADGMGGHQGGDIASQLIVASLAELPAKEDFDERLKDIRHCLHWLNRRLGQELTVTAGHPDSIMGSTVVALLLEGDRAACVWAGDSRCYLWRGQRLYQLSRDHSLQQQLIDEQGMSVEQAKAHPAAHALTRAVGAAEQLTLDVLELEVYPGDTFLLCSDGLYQGLSSDALGNALSLSAPHVVLERLFDGALHGSAKDNLTAVVIRQ